MKLNFTGWHLGAWALPVVASALFAPSLLAQPSLSISGTTVTEGNTGSVQAVVTVTLTPASSGVVTVNYESSTATPPATGGAACGASGIDFVNPSGTVQFDAGVTSQTISVAVCGDTAQEPDEKFRVRLRNAVGATIGTAQGTVTIIDDDDQPPTPSVSIEDVSISEGSGGTTIKNAIVRLSATTGQPVTVTVAVQPGGTASATSACPAGGDFLAFLPQTVTINPGQTELGVPFTICGDTAVEPDESITVVLREPVNATLLDSQAQVTIPNDDVSPPTVSIEDDSLSEGSRGITGGSATVRLSATPSRPVTVTVALQTGGTASGGSTCVLNTDFLGFPPRTLTFNPGQTVQSVPFSICADTSFEPDETFSLALSNPSGATLGDGVGQMTIQDDDGAPVTNTPPPPITGVALIISSFQVKGGLPFATRQGPKPLNVTASGGPTEFRSSFATTPACEAALQSQAFQPFSASDPPNAFLGNEPGRRHVCIQLRRGTSTSLVAKDDIEIVPSSSSSIVMGRNLRRVAGLDAEQIVNCGGLNRENLAIGISVRASALVDAIGLRCADMGPNGEHSNVTSTPLIGGGDGPVRALDCAPGQVLYGFQGRSGEFIDSVGIRCIGWRADIGSNGTHILRATAGGTGGDSAFGPEVCPGPLAVDDLTARKHFSFVGGLRFGCRAPRGM